MALTSSNLIILINSLENSVNYLHVVNDFCFRFYLIICVSIFLDNCIFSIGVYVILKQSFDFLLIDFTGVVSNNTFLILVPSLALDTYIFLYLFLPRLTIKVFLFNFCLTKLLGV